MNLSPTVSLSLSLRLLSFREGNKTFTYPSSRINKEDRYISIVVTPYQIMGNLHGSLGVCCAATPEHILLNDNDNNGEKMIDKSGRTQSTAKMSVSSSQEDSTPVREGFSFSSISSKSSGNGSGSGNCDSRQESSYPPPEMRNDAAEWYHSISDEIRVAESSYDEATTEAVNLYYGDSRYPAQHNAGRRDGVEQQREA